MTYSLEKLNSTNHSDELERELQIKVRAQSINTFEIHFAPQNLDILDF